MALPRDVVRVIFAFCNAIGAPIFRAIRVQDLTISSSSGDADSVIVARYRGKIADEQYTLSPPTCPTDERNYAVVPVVKVDPFEPFPTEVLLPECAMAAIELIEIRKETAKLVVRLML